MILGRGPASGEAYITRRLGHCEAARLACELGSGEILRGSGPACATPGEKYTARVAAEEVPTRVGANFMGRGAVRPKIPRWPCGPNATGGSAGRLGARQSVGLVVKNCRDKNSLCRLHSTHRRATHATRWHLAMRNNATHSKRCCRHCLCTWQRPGGNAASRRQGHAKPFEAHFLRCWKV